MTETISDRQRTIIEAAGKTLGEFGISGLTIKNLAKELKFSESAIYRHFASKEDIILALLGYLAKNMDERCAGVLHPALKPEEKFVALFQNQFSFFNDNPHFVVAVICDGLMEESRRINESIQKLMSVMMKHLSPIILEGQQSGVFTTAITRAELAHITVGAFRLQMFQWRVANFQFDITSMGDKMIQSILIIIKNKDHD